MTYGHWNRRHTLNRAGAHLRISSALVLMLGLITQGCVFDDSRLDDFDSGSIDTGTGDVTLDPGDDDTDLPDADAGDTSEDEDPEGDANDADDDTDEPDDGGDDTDDLGDLGDDDLSDTADVDDADLGGDAADATDSGDVEDGGDAPDLADLPPNEPPELTTPASISVQEQRSTIVSGMSVADPDADDDLLEFRLETSIGTLTMVPVPAGLVFLDGDGLDDPEMVFEASQTVANEGFAILAFNAPSSAGEGTLSVQVDDRGSNGAGGAQTDSASIAVTVIDNPLEVHVQRGSTVIPSGTTTHALTAGVDYDAPAGSAFVRIVNTRSTGMGRTNGGGEFDANTWMVWLDDSVDVSETIQFRRWNATNDCRVTWELISYNGDAESDDAWVVRDTGAVLMSGSQTSATGAVVADIDDDADVLVLITGQAGSGAETNRMESALARSEWLGDTDEPIFTRAEHRGRACWVSYAVIEYVGDNWAVERVTHDYATPGSEETLTIADVGELSSAFLHTQHSTGNSGLDEAGGEVWLSSTTEVTLLAQDGADLPVAATVWVVSNAGTGAGALEVDHYSGLRLDGASEEDTWTETIVTVPDIAGASIMGESGRSSGTDDGFPEGSVDLMLEDESTVRLYQSESNGLRSYRFSVVNWPDE